MCKERGVLRLKISFFRIRHIHKLNDRWAMSIREGKGTFNLRSVVVEETASRPLFLSPAAVEHPFPQTTGDTHNQASRLKFDFSPLAKKSATLTAAQSLDIKAAILKTNSVPNSTDKSDVMRLTVMVDDLTLRLKRASERAHAAEAQLTKTHNCLVKEREDASRIARTISLERSAAQVKEVSLLKKISDISEHTVSNDAFQNAIAATVTAEDTIKALNKRVLDLEQTSQEDCAKLSAITEELIEMHACNSDNIQRCTETQMQYDGALEELCEARKQESIVSGDLIGVQSQLESCIKRASEAEEMLQSMKEECVKGEMPFKITEGDVVLNVDDKDEDGDEENDKDEDGDDEDAVGMNTEYNELRVQIGNLQKKIEETDSPRV